LSDHEKVVARIAREYEKRGFQVQSRGNNLPQGSKRTGAIYRPDLLVRDSTTGKILCIVEIETSDAGKAVVGATVLADICMEIEGKDQQERPTLVFIFYRLSANLDLAKKRLAQLMQQDRMRHLADILIWTESQAIERIKQ
jgi:hypothetical protein